MLHISCFVRSDLVCMTLLLPALLSCLCRLKPVTAGPLRIWRLRLIQGSALTLRQAGQLIAQALQCPLSLHQFSYL